MIAEPQYQANSTAPVEVIEVPTDKFQLEWALRCGSKNLIMWVTDYGNGFTAKTHISTNTTRRIQDETTSIYAAARDLLQQLADRTQVVVKYEFQTINSKMQRWAQGKGRDIFQWNSVKSNEFGLLVSEADFSPRTLSNDQQAA